MKVNNIFKNCNSFTINDEIKCFLKYFNHVSNPLITVCIPTYNRPNLLRRSMLSILDQRLSINVEIVIVDNTEDEHIINETKYIINYCIKNFPKNNISYYQNEKNIGMFGNWNRCIQLARCQRMTILNDDDIFLDGIFSVSEIYSYNSLLAFDRLELSHGTERTGVISKTLRFIKNFPMSYRGIQVSDFIIGNPFSSSLGIFFIKDKAVKIGGFNKSYFPSSDYHFFLRYINKFSGEYSYKKYFAYNWEDNVSLKPETLEGFSKVSLLIRKELLNQLDIGKFNYKIYKFIFSFTTFIHKRRKNILLTNAIYYLFFYLISLYCRYFYKNTKKTIKL